MARYKAHASSAGGDLSPFDSPRLHQYVDKSQPIEVQSPGDGVRYSDVAKFGLSPKTQFNLDEKHIQATMARYKEPGGQNGAVV